MPEKFFVDAKPDRRAVLIDGLLLYRSIAGDEVFRSLQRVLESIAAPEPSAREIYRRYHHFVALALRHRWPDYLMELILDDENNFTEQAAEAGPEGVPPALKELAARDLSILQELARIEPAELKKTVAVIFKAAGKNIPHDPFHPLNPETWPEWPAGPVVREVVEEAGTAAARLQMYRRRMKEALSGAPQWGALVDELARYHHRAGCGIFGRYAAFRWQKRPGGGELAGIPNPDPVQLEQLIGLEREKAVIMENTEHFLSGRPANNIILYGDRGTGKSSTVKALLHAYVSRGLRLVEVARDDLGDFPSVTRRLAGRPYKFIVFVDDLSFDETESEYRTLKTVLEGGVEAAAENVLIYATSNRRHLIKETFSERQGDEVHVRDNMEEKLSLADRFGITVTFPAPDQEGYLKIVEEMAARRGLAVERDELRRLALHWEMWHHGRSGRTARQFIDYLTARVKG